MHGGWTALYESGAFTTNMSTVNAEVDGANLQAHGIPHPDALEGFPYGPAELNGEQLKQWHGELRRRYLHEIINTAVAVEHDALAVDAWQEVGYQAVRERLGGLSGRQSAA